jgi:Trk K+ transport system NAD-binding subunit
VRRRFVTALRRAAAHAISLWRPLRNFLPLLAVVAAVVVVGGACFERFYDKARLDGHEARYLVFCLIFLEHLYPWPEHWLLRVFYWTLPVLGLVVVLEGIVRFADHVVRRDESGRLWNRAMSVTMRRHVVLCGLGKLGLRILEQLLQLGETVVVLEKDPQCPNLRFARSQGVSVLVGTGREEGILEDLHVSAAKSIILATNDDLANLEMALDARKLAPDIRVVLRMFDPELAVKVRESFDISAAFSASALAAPLFAVSSSDRSILNSFYVGTRLVVVARLDVRADGGLVGLAADGLRAAHRVQLVQHERGDATQMFPPGDLKLAAGDRLTVQTELPDLHRLHRLNGGPDPTT